MSPGKVLDSYAILAFLENEPGANKVHKLIKAARDGGPSLYMSVINWGEVYYIIHRESGPKGAQVILDNLDALPIEIIDADWTITKVAASFKAKHKMSYADCFAAALAKYKKLELVTGDKEFKEVEKEVRILWIN